MNWLAELQKRRGLCVGGILSISLLALVVSLQRNPVSFDAFWHLKTGADWLSHGLSPWVDHYSFTYQGEAIRNPPVAFQALLHLAVAALGVFGGFLLVKALAQAVTLLAAYLFLREVRARALLIAIVIPCIVALLQMRSFVRPELFSYAFSVLAMWLYFRAGERASASSVLPMVILMVAWTNYHSSIIGYVIFAGFFLDCATRQLRERASMRAWLTWLAWGLVLLAVGFLNPAFNHPLIEALTFPEEWKTYIFEYFAPWPYIKESPGLVILLLVMAVAPLLAIRRGKLGLLLVWAVLAYAAASMQRMVVPAGIVIVIMMAGLLAANGFPEKSLGTGRRAFLLSGLLWFSVAAAALFANVVLSLDILKENRSTFTRYPEALTRYMLDQGLAGPVFNDYGIGGYLIYRLAPHNQVYIDGRTHILYPVTHLEKFEAIQGSPRLLLEESRALGIDLVIEPFKQEKHDLVIASGDFTLDFVDAGYSLYRRHGGRFTAHGELMSRPACWPEAVPGALASERKLIAEGLPFYSGLARFSEFVAGYVEASDKQAYFDASFESREWNDFERRFAAFRALEAGQFDMARILLANVQHLRIEDYLASGLAMILSGNDDLAIHIMRSLAVEDWMSANPFEKAMYLQLWQAIGDHENLAEPDLQFIESLRQEVHSGGSAAAGSPFEMRATAFCDIARRYTRSLQAAQIQ